MNTFSKAQLASIMATGVDFSISWVLLHAAGLPIMVSGPAGTLCGGVTHFLISRNWVFRAQERKWHAQAPRYVLVWIGNFLLNYSGLWLLTHFTGIKDMFAKVITAVMVAVCYNYVLQKRFVFK